MKVTYRQLKESIGLLNKIKVQKGLDGLSAYYFSKLLRKADEKLKELQQDLQQVHEKFEDHMKEVEVEQKDNKGNVITDENGDPVTSKSLQIPDDEKAKEYWETIEQVLNEEVELEVKELDPEQVLASIDTKEISPDELMKIHWAFKDK